MNTQNPQLKAGSCNISNANGPITDCLGAAGSNTTANCTVTSTNGPIADCTGSAGAGGSCDLTPVIGSGLSGATGLVFPTLTSLSQQISASCGGGSTGGTGAASCNSLIGVPKVPGSTLFSLIGAPVPGISTGTLFGDIDASFDVLFDGTANGNASCSNVGRNNLCTISKTLDNIFGPTSSLSTCVFGFGTLPYTGCSQGIVSGSFNNVFNQFAADLFHAVNPASNSAPHVYNFTTL